MVHIPYMISMIFLHSLNQIIIVACNYVSVIIKIEHKNVFNSLLRYTLLFHRCQVKMFNPNLSGRNFFAMATLCKKVWYHAFESVLEETSAIKKIGALFNFKYIDFEIQWAILRNSEKSETHSVNKVSSGCLNSENEIVSFSQKNTGMQEELLNKQTYNTVWNILKDKSVFEFKILFGF